MKKGIIVISGLLLVAALLTVSMAGCSNNSPAVTAPTASPVIVSTQTEGIWVSGTGKVTVTPDIALLQLGIEAQEISVAEALAKASEAMEKVMTALTDSGVAEKDIQTQNFRIRQRTRWDEMQQDEVVVGYRVTNDVIAKIRDLEKTGDIIDAVVVAGGDYTRIDDLNFSVDDPTGYYDEAREKAMADAKGKAEKIANLAGMKLGDPTYIAESSSTPYLGGMGYKVAVPAPTPAPAPIIVEAPPISPGEVEISVNVQVSYDLEDKSPVVVEGEPEIIEPQE